LADLAYHVYKSGCKISIIIIIITDDSHQFCCLFEIDIFISNVISKHLFPGLLTAIAVGIFGGNFRDDKNQAPFGWAYWCGVVAAMILIVNGAIMMAISMFVYRKRGGFTRRK